MSIGLIPLSAKPYHSAHHHIVQLAARENSKVILYVSTSDRIKEGEFPIYGKSMLEVWKREIENILPKNVEIVYGGSPVRKVYEFIGDACKYGIHGDYVVYSDIEDTKNNYSMSYRQKYMQPLHEMGNIAFAAEVNPDMYTRGSGAPNCSGTLMRKYLQENNKKDFFDGLPNGIDKNWIFKFLRNN